jgi:hypothetical protein
MREVITHAAQVTPEWLTAVLHKSGCLPQGNVAAVSKKPSAPGFSTIVPLELGYTDDAPPSAPARLVLKLAGAGELSTGKEEVEFYTRVAAAMSDPPVVRCYDAVMMAVFWFPERRARLKQCLLRRYHRRLGEGGVEAYDWESCWYDYRFAVIGYLFYPIWQWSTDHPDFIWWHHLERLMLAFQDLGCEELLGR